MLPPQTLIEMDLLRLLHEQPSGAMTSAEAYDALRKRYSYLTAEELFRPYRNSKSHFANRVQWARLRLVEAGLVYSCDEGPGRGIWKITPAGSERILAWNRDLKMLHDLFDDPPLSPTATPSMPPAIQGNEAVPEVP